MAKDYYLVLGLSRGADLNRIKRAYRTIAKKYHPDASRSEDTTERFLEVQEAFDTLADSEKRRLYEEELAREVKIVRIPEAVRFRRKAAFQRMRELASPTDDFFSGIVPGFFDVHRGRIPGKDLYFEAVLSPTEAAEGGLYPITVPVMAPCPRCSGMGLWEGFFCPVCHGYGRIQSDRGFSLSIPPGVRDGTEIAISLEDIGLRAAYLNILVTIDPDVE